MIPFREESPEVLYAADGLARVGAEEVAWLKQKALDNPRRRIRLCAHPDPTASLHEMIIVHYSGIYVRPHRHLGRGESFHIIEGSCWLLIFDEEGGLKERSRLSASGRDAAFFYRMNQSLYHSLLIDPGCLVFHETTQGPFDPASTLFAPWSPPDDGSAKAAAFMEKMRQMVAG